MKVLFLRNGPIAFCDDDYRHQNFILKFFSDLKLGDEVRVFCFENYAEDKYLKFFSRKNFGRKNNVYTLFSLNNARTCNVITVSNFKSILNLKKSDVYLSNNALFIELGNNKNKLLKEDINNLMKKDLELLHKNNVAVEEKLPKIDEANFTTENDIFLYPIKFDYDNTYTLFYYAVLENANKNFILFPEFHKIKSNLLILVLRNIFKKIIANYFELGDSLPTIERDISYLLTINYSEKYYDEEPTKLTIGCELEFELLNSKTSDVYHAMSVLRDYYRLIDEPIEESSFFRTKIGTDGNTTTGELRTNYYKIENKDELKKDLENLIKSVVKIVKHPDINNIYDEIKLSFGSYRIPIGFHFHIGFGNNKNTSNFYIYNRKNLVRLFDLVLGSLFMDLNCRARFRTFYSNLSNTEEKVYGFEYRTLPASVGYYELYKDIIDLVVKLLEDLTKKNFVEVPLDQQGIVSEEFYINNIPNGKQFINKILILLRNLYTNYCFVEEGGQLVMYSIGRVGFAFKPNVFYLFDSINRFTKDCWILPYGLRESRGEYANTVYGTEHYIPVNLELAFPYVERKIEILGRTYYHIPVGLSYALRTENYANPENPEKVKVLSQIVETLVKNLETRKLLKENSKVVLKELKEEFPFLVFEN